MMLCEFQVYSKMLQLYLYMYPFFFRFFTHIGYYRILNQGPCANKVGPCWLFILYIVVCICNPKFLIYPSLLTPLKLTLQSQQRIIRSVISKCVLSFTFLTLLLFCFVVVVVVLFFIVLSSEDFLLGSYSTRKEFPSLSRNTACLEMGGTKSWAEMRMQAAHQWVHSQSNRLSDPDVNLYLLPWSYFISSS